MVENRHSDQDWTKPNRLKKTGPELDYLEKTGIVLVRIETGSSGKPFIRPDYEQP